MEHLQQEKKKMYIIIGIVAAILLTLVLAMSIQGSSMQGRFATHSVDLSPDIVMP